jgi:hypothetical protein
LKIGNQKSKRLRKNYMAEPTYTVRANDGGWYQISQKLTRERGYRVDWRELKRLNPQYVRPGDVLYGNGTEVLTLPPRPGTAPAVTTGTAKLKDDLRNMANGSDFSPGRNHERVRDRINAASAQEKREALADQPLLTVLRLKMDFFDFAMAVELLGRQAPTGKQLSENAVVKSACDAAWAASNADAKNPDEWRENGGYIFMNLVSGEISTSTVPAGNLGQRESSKPRLENHSREHNRGCQLPHASESRRPASLRRT